MTETLDGQVTEFSPRVGVQAACNAFGVSVRSYRHRQQKLAGRLPARKRQRKAERKEHPAALSMAEKIRVLEELCSERFYDSAPQQVHAKLLDEGVHLCSVSTMYRLLTDHGLTGDRRRGGHQRRGQHAMPVLQATKPNECWSWDITKLPGPQKRVSYFLYSIIDIFSRKIVGWTVADRESELIARVLIQRTTEREGIKPETLTLHSNRGSAMISGTVAELLCELAVTKSHSRPRVSNDNPFSEANFKTLKYRPDYPKRFQGIQHARSWAKEFFHWYNYEHYHSGISFLHPADLHAGTHHQVIEKRQTTLDAAYASNPARFNRKPQASRPPEETWINKPHMN